MSKVRHESAAPTRTLRLASGDQIPAHRHDDHQIVYAGRGVLAVTTNKGSWIAPATRAIWIPAGTFHAHRAYGELKLHTVGLAAADNPLELDSPTVLTVAPLLRELIDPGKRASEGLGKPVALNAVDWKIKHDSRRPLLLRFRTKHSRSFAPRTKHGLFKLGAMRKHHFISSKRSLNR
jgi:mannose-6-phosphate isomerase-like protein (cupin superfamily)